VSYPVEPNKAKRNSVGLRALDSGRACPAYTLFTPNTTGRTVYLIGPDGNLVHTWDAPYPPGNYGYLTERGTLIYNGRTPEVQQRLSEPVAPERWGLVGDGLERRGALGGTPS
jgi:hypothetical protein